MLFLRLPGRWVWVGPCVAESLSQFSGPLDDQAGGLAGGPGRSGFAHSPQGKVAQGGKIGAIFRSVLPPPPWRQLHDQGLQRSACRDSLIMAPRELGLGKSVILKAYH